MAVILPESQAAQTGPEPAPGGPAPASARPGGPRHDGTPGSNGLGAGTVLLDRYRLDRILGQGGFGITYLAADRSLGSLVAIKEFFPRSAAVRTPPEASEIVTPTDTDVFKFGLARFVQEARLLAEFRSNPRIVSVYDVFQANGTAYIVMEFLRGRTLAEIHAAQPDRKLPFDRIRVAVTEILLALEAVHERGLLHQDLTPDNIFLSEAQHVRLIDFGAARSFTTPPGSDERSLGKHGYAAIEQYRNAATDLGPWTDLYALGAGIYRLTTGRRLPRATERLGPSDPLESLSKLPVAVPRSVADAVMRALAVEPGDRFQSADAMRQALAAPAANPARRTAGADAGTDALAPDGLCLGRDALKEAARSGLTTEVMPAPGVRNGKTAALGGAQPTTPAWTHALLAWHADGADEAAAAPAGATRDCTAGERTMMLPPVAEVVQAMAAHDLYLRGRRGGRRLMFKFLHFSGIALAGKSFARSDLVGCSFLGCTLTDADFREANLYCADFRYADLRGADFRQADLRGAKFDHANLTGARFDKADCREGTLMLQRAPGELLDARAEQDQLAASFREARLNRATFAGADLTRADLSGAEIKQARFDGAELSNADLSGCLVEACCFDNAKVTGTKLYAARVSDEDRRHLEGGGARVYRPAADLGEALPTLVEKHLRWSASLAGDGRQLHLVGMDLGGWQADGLDLSVAVFEHCNLARASLKATTLAMARFTDCDLTEADLTEADARGVQLLSCDLRKARLSNANLGWLHPISGQSIIWHSVLKGSDLTDANLDGCRLDRADLTGATLPAP